MAFAAVAALVSGLSVANAQSKVDGKDPLVTGPVGLNAAVCSKAYGNPSECRYATLAECRKDVGPGADCSPNPKHITTNGSGDSMDKSRGATMEK
ncbi:MAG: hypothetical protein ACR2K5_15235 [Pseudolabrys sp.]